MIIGIGTDIILVKRIEEVFSKQKETFINRVLTENEKTIFNSFTNPQKQMNYLAKRFSAKEAASKALGTGIGADASFLDFEILNNKKGAPILNVTGKALKTLETKIKETTNFQNPKIKFHISLSDTEEHAHSYVILEAVE